MLRVENIEVRYNRVPAIHDVSFTVGRGELISIVGANGSGKTTLLKTVAGTLHPTKGSMEFEGMDISTASQVDIVRMGMTYVPEDRLIFGPLTVEENLKVGLAAREARFFAGKPRWLWPIWISAGLSLQWFAQSGSG